MNTREFIYIYKVKNLDSFKEIYPTVVVPVAAILFRKTALPSGLLPSPPKQGNRFGGKKITSIRHLGKSETLSDNKLIAGLPGQKYAYWLFYSPGIKEELNFSCFFFCNRLRVVPLSLSPSRVTRKKTARLKKTGSAFFTRFSFASRTTDQAKEDKEGLLVVNFVVGLRDVSCYLRDSSLIDGVRAKTALGQSSFKSAASREWNSLPRHLRDITSMQTFKSNLFKYFLNLDVSSHVCSVS